MGGEDFVEVKLSAAGETAGQLAIRGGGYEYVFEPGKTVRVSAAEYRARLEAVQHQGQAAFEIVPAVAKSVADRPARGSRVTNHESPVTEV